MDHIKLYQILLAKKKDEIEQIKRKLSFGLEKLYNTNEIVAKLQEEMTILKPQLAEQSVKTETPVRNLKFTIPQPAPCGSRRTLGRTHRRRVPDSHRAYTRT